MPCPKGEAYNTKDPTEIALQVSDSPESIPTLQFCQELVAKCIQCQEIALCCEWLLKPGPGKQSLHNLKRKATHPRPIPVSAHPRPIPVSPHPRPIPVAALSFFSMDCCIFVWLKDIFN